MSVEFDCHVIKEFMVMQYHQYLIVQVCEKPAKTRKKPACAPKSQPKVKKTALKENEKEPKNKKQKTTHDKDDSKSTPRSKASKRSSQSAQEDVSTVKKPKAAGAKAAVKSKAKANAKKPCNEEPETVPAVPETLPAVPETLPAVPETLPDGQKVTRVRKPPVSAEPVEAVASLEMKKAQEPGDGGDAREPAVAAPHIPPAEEKTAEPMVPPKPCEDQSQSQWSLGYIKINMMYI